jgi:hypothetical protein
MGYAIFLRRFPLCRPEPSFWMVSRFDLLPPLLPTRDDAGQERKTSQKDCITHFPFPAVERKSHRGAQKEENTRTAPVPAESAEYDTKC